MDYRFQKAEYIHIHILFYKPLICAVSDKPEIKFSST